MIRFYTNSVKLVLTVKNDQLIIGIDINKDVG